METKYIIYALVDKNDVNNIRYIGQTGLSLKQRLSQHINEKKLSHKTNWINKIGKNNVNIICLLDNITLEDVDNEERFLIKKYKSLGYKLTNVTDGGKGWQGMKLTEIHKQNISKQHADFSGDKNPMFGKNHTNESLQKISDVKKEKFKSLCFK